MASAVGQRAAQCRPASAPSGTRLLTLTAKESPTVDAHEPVNEVLEIEEYVRVRHEALLRSARRLTAS
jgi:hypothetical protein